MPKRRLKKNGSSSSKDYKVPPEDARSKYFKLEDNKSIKRNERQSDEKYGGEPSNEPANPVSASIAESSKLASTGDASPRCGFSFFNKPCEELAKQLLGKTLVRKLDTGERLSGTIVETEAYIGGEDKGSHSFQGKRTAKNEAMYMRPGTAYVYHIYGMYTCLNISSFGE